MNLTVCSAMMRLNVYFQKFIHNLWINFIYKLYDYLQGFFLIFRGKIFILCTSYTQSVKKRQRKDCVSDAKISVKIE